MGRMIDEYEDIKTQQKCVSKTIDTLWEMAQKYQQLQADYENRLKADMAAMLTDIQLEIREHDPGCGWEGYADKNVIDCIIQQKINELNTLKNAFGMERKNRAMICATLLPVHVMY